MAYSSMQYIRDTYGVPAKRGARVEYTGGKQPRAGTITGTGGCGILVRLDGDKHSLPFHPTWELRYLTPNEEDTVTVSLRMTIAQRDKLALLGGAAWVRQRIDKAKGLR